jgi:hypothetical protein
LDVGIGFAIYLSEGIADSSVQVLNPSRCSSYTPQACERARIVFYIDYEKSGVEETANGTDITCAKCELIPAASKAIFLHSPRQAGHKTRFQTKTKVLQIPRSNCSRSAALLEWLYGMVQGGMGT